MPKVTFEPSGRAVEVPEGASVLDAAQLAGATTVECCGILPACGSCRMVVVAGEEHLSAPDDLEGGVRRDRAFLPFERLACMAHVAGDVTVEMER